MMPVSLPDGRALIPNIMGMLGPVISASSGLPPEKVSRHNVSLKGQKGGINGEENLYSGTDHQGIQDAIDAHEASFTLAMVLEASL